METANLIVYVSDDGHITSSCETNDHPTPRGRYKRTHDGLRYAIAPKWWLNRDTRPNEESTIAWARGIIWSVHVWFEGDISPMVSEAFPNEAAASRFAQEYASTSGVVKMFGPDVWMHS